VAAQNPQREIKFSSKQVEGKGRLGARSVCGGAGIFCSSSCRFDDAPEELPKFYEAARSGIADFVMAWRLVYPMENEAMQFLKHGGQQIFRAGRSVGCWASRSRILCAGTKVLFRSHYELIARNRIIFGDFDPFGDFDLLFGAARLNLRIIDLPIRFGRGHTARPIFRVGNMAGSSCDGLFCGQTLSNSFMTPLQKHQKEIQKNLDFWRRKPLLQKIYAGFLPKDHRFDRPVLWRGSVVEIGSGIGNFKGADAGGNLHRSVSEPVARSGLRWL